MNKIEQNKQEIIRLYFKENKPMSYIAKEFGISKTGISNMFKRESLIARTNGETKRKYKVDENYFDVIDSSNKAYILGFLYADGYNNPITKSMILDLKESDKDILERISKEMKNEMPLYHYSFVNKTDKVERHQCRLIVNSKHIHERLIELGVIPNKTFVIEFPFWLPKNLMSHFIRGYFDGDGCFSYLENKRSYINICSSSSFCDGLVQYLQENEGINLHINKLTKKDERNSVIRTSNKNETKKFLEYIYKDADLKMERKYEIAVKFLTELK